MKPTSPRRNLASPASDRANTSSPAKSTRPPVGRSSVPSTCSKVDFPTPEAPITATLSPAFTVSVTPRRTRTTSGPSRYSFSRSSVARRGSLIAEHLNGVQPGGAARRGQGREERDHQGGADDHGEVGPGELHGQIADLIHVAREPDDLVGVLHPDEQEAEGASRHRPDDADQHARHEEDGTDGGRARPHGLEDADLLALLGDQQHQVA